MMILYKCEKCGNSIRKHYFSKKGIVDEIDCGECGGKLERQLSAPSSKSTQVIDNGIQARKVEVIDAVVEKERERILSGDKN